MVSKFSKASWISTNTGSDEKLIRFWVKYSSHIFIQVAQMGLQTITLLII